MSFMLYPDSYFWDIALLIVSFDWAHIWTHKYRLKSDTVPLRRPLCENIEIDGKLNNLLLFFI